MQHTPEATAAEFFTAAKYHAKLYTMARIGGFGFKRTAKALGIVTADLLRRALLRRDETKRALQLREKIAAGRPFSDLDPRDWRIDRCDLCGKPDAVKRRTRRRHCMTCRLERAAVQADERAKTLRAMADRAHLDRRLLVAAVEAEREKRAREAWHAQHVSDGGGIVTHADAIGVWQIAGSSHDFRGTSEVADVRDAGVRAGGDVPCMYSCDAPPPCFKLRHLARARDAMWHARDSVMRQRGHAATSARRVAWHGFGAGDWTIMHERPPSKVPAYKRVAGGSSRCSVLADGFERIAEVR